MSLKIHSERIKLASYFTENTEVTRRKPLIVSYHHIYPSTSICSHKLSACGHRSTSLAPIQSQTFHLSIRSHSLYFSKTISRKSSPSIFYFLQENSIGIQHAIIIHLSFKKSSTDSLPLSLFHFFAFLSNKTQHNQLYSLTPIPLLSFFC